MTPKPPGDGTPLWLTLPAAAQSVGGVRDAVTGLARRAGFPDSAISAIAVAVSEAATNVVQHAYRGAVAKGPLHVRAWLRDEELCVEVIDEGPGVRPRVDSPGLGLGMPLIAALAAHIELGLDDVGRNCVRMSFERFAGVR